MIWVDFVITGVAICCVMTGIWRGFGSEVFAIVNWFVAVAVSLKFDTDFVRFVPTISDHPATRIAGGFTALLLITLVLGTAIGLLLSVLGNNRNIGFFSRMGGMIMAVVRSVIIITVLVMLAGVTPLPKDTWWQESKLLPPFQLLAVGLRDHVSSGLAEYVNYR